jgi:hypothetical protein
MSNPAATPRGPAPPGPPGLQRHLVIVHQPGWQSIADWRDIGGRVRRIDPTIGVLVVSALQDHTALAERAAGLPTLVFSAGPLGKFRPLRGKVYHGGPMPKFQQLRRLLAGGVRVPRTQVLTEGARFDPQAWGEFVVVKPTDMASSSKAAGIQLMRTERVRYIAPGDYPQGHPGRRGPMVVQQFIDTGPQLSTYRVLTLFGEPLYCEYNYLDDSELDLTADDPVIETTNIAIQGDTMNRHRIFQYDADMVALARAAHHAIPEVPLKGCDILRDHRTGRLYVIEVNPNSNTWHFSSRFMAKLMLQYPDKFPPELARQRLEQLDAFGTAAHVLAETTRREAM